MAYVNLYNPSSNVTITQLVRIGSFTYVIGRISVFSDSVTNQFYIAKLSLNGNLIWHKRYLFSDADIGAGLFDRPHFRDIVEMPETGDLILLGADRSNFLILKLNQDGDLIWAKKHYDKSDTPVIHTNLTARARLFKLNEETLVLKITEVHSLNGGVRRIDHKFLSIEPEDGGITAGREIISENPILIIRDEEVRDGNLVLFGYEGGKAAIITVDPDLNIVQSVGIYYAGDVLKGFNYLHIYAVSPVYNGKYSVLGSFYHYDPEQDLRSEEDKLDFILNDERDDSIPHTVLEFLVEFTEPLPNRFTRFFTAEISEDHGSVSNEKLLDRDFSATYQTVHHNTDGIFFSISGRLYKLNSSLTQSDWVKRIRVQELNQNQLLINRSIGNTFDSYSFMGTGTGSRFSVASTDFDYESCRTETVDDSVSLINQEFEIKEIEVPIDDYSPIAYDEPPIEPIDFDSNEMEELCPSGEPQPDLEQSTITADPTSILADGTSVSEITVQLNDASGNPVTAGGPYLVEILFSAGSMPVSSGNADANGQFITQLESSTIEETSFLEFTVDGQGPSPNTATVQFIAVGVSIEISKITAIQSPYLYIQASGSEGNDSTRGRHLRWAFRGVLGEKHLPKGDYASDYVNFNKPKDFVKIYKAAYRKKVIRLDLIQDSPEVVDNANRLWIYRIGGKEFYVHFRNTAKYDQVRSTIDPMTHPYQFIGNYGSELIEIENIKELFFAVTCNFSQRLSHPHRDFEVETLSVTTNTLVANKVVTNRKAISDDELNTPLKLLFENGRAVRWQIFDTQLVSLDFEFYSETIEEINKTTGWVEMGNFALTLDQGTAFSQLEPAPGDVHGIWQRFNEDGLVNIENYHHKWGAAPEPGDRNIRQVVEQYIQLSDDVNNPAAIEHIPLENDPSDPEDYMEISNLDMLNFSANDYHIARMLGLGILDIDYQTPGIKSTNVYVAEYYTTADLEDGLGERDVQHLFMSLPTSNLDFRLPVPVDLDHIAPGVFLDEDNEDAASLTDEDGYAHDGISRYVSLYSEELPEDDVNTPFFVTDEEIDLSIVTTPVYGGLKYRLNAGGWRKPELANDRRYYNVVPQGDPFYETRFILIPEPLRPFYTHRQTANGVHTYKSYGINWFSRAKVSDVEISIETLLKQKNPLIPPSNTNALLVREESPLLLSSGSEQERLAAIGSGDKTLIRLTYDYHSFHELKNYNIPLDSPWSNVQLTDPNNANNPIYLFPDNEEIFAEEVDIFFRNRVPNNVTGKALTVADHGSNELLSVITTGNYEIVTTGETLVPFIAPGSENNYVGGVFVSGDNKYVIHEVTQGSQGPTFIVYKKELSDSVFVGDVPLNPPVGDLVPPVLVTDGLFMAIENMQNAASWGTPNPLDFKVKIGNNDWYIHREVIESIDDDGNVQRQVEKTRGIWGTAAVVEDDESMQPGVYKVTFNNVLLPNHPQYDEQGVSAEWYKGIIRIFTESAVSGTVPNKTRKVLPVIWIDNVGTSNNLTLLIQDPAYNENDPDYDPIQTGSSIEVNFYPGYRVYLYEDATYGLDEPNILPAEGEGIRYSIFGFRSHDPNGGCDPVSGSCLSRISVPCLMFAQELIDALPPEQPEGPLYATRPDFFGRSTYTLTTRYQHKPYGVLFYRSNDEALLNVLYEKETVKDIREQLEALGGNDEEYLTNRWTNFLNFDELASDGDYKVYPPAGVSPDGYKFPNPDKQAFFDWANHILARLQLPPITDDPGTLTVGDPKIINFVKGAIYSAFVALTEVPIIYQYLNGENYKPVDRPQVIKDRDGNTLVPGSEGFEMAPMMKIIGSSPHETLFTDFKLDGTSNNLYFYGVKELNPQLKMSDFSPFLGPVKLVNTNAPEMPEIKRIIPVLENTALGISPKIQLEVNAFPKVQNIKKLTVYRAYSKIQAASVQTMQVVKIVDLDQEGLLDDDVWTVTDNFDDLVEIPYGDGLFYRITVSREVEYAESDGTIVTEYAPSRASKIVASLVVEAYAPQSPVLKFLSTAPDSNDEIHSVSLQWTKAAYNAKYHVYKMNSQGNWAEIHKLHTNDDDIVVDLADTDLQSDTLKLTNDEGDAVYHHFKIIAENTAGMLSIEEYILTIFNEEDWIEV